MYVCIYNTTKDEKLPKTLCNHELPAIISRVENSITIYSNTGSSKINEIGHLKNYCYVLYAED